MKMTIVRDSEGVVTITDTTTGRSERIETSTKNKPLERGVAASEELPAHMFGRL
jgi:hypothetical protein